MKAIRGQTYPGYKKVNITQLRKALAAGPIKGFMVGNRVNKYHFHKGWALACDFEIYTLAEFERQHNSFRFYLESELGNRAAFYLKIPRAELAQQQPLVR